MSPRLPGEGRERRFGAVCFDWGGTLMSEAGPQDRPMASWPEVKMIDGAAEALAALSGKYRLCIATNASISRRPMIERALERVGLRGYFSELFCFTEIGHRKDEPEFWQTVSRTLALPLDRIAMVGDSIEQDVLAPRRFGVATVWFNEAGRHPAPAEPLRQVTWLPEFSRWVDTAA